MEEEDASTILSKPIKNGFAKRKPWYIIHHNAWCLNWYKGLIYILTIPNICFSVFVVAFGVEWSIYDVTLFMDIFYFIEIVLAFFTSYSDNETYAEEYSLKKIAINYTKHGSFILNTISTIPFGLLFRESFNH